MRRMFFTCLAVAAAAVLASGCRSPRSDPQSHPEPAQRLDPAAHARVRTLSAGTDGFAIDLYQLLSRQPGNLILSPFSIQAALCMTYAGAAGGTAGEMRKTLRLSLPADSVHAVYRSLLEDLAARSQEGDCRLEIANRLWAHHDAHFLDHFLRTTRENYGAEAERLDFESDPESARKAINRWVSDRTEGLIAELFAPGTIDQMTRLALTNAIYFKGLWAVPFEPKATRDETFHLTRSDSVTAPTMVRQGHYRYAHHDGVSVVELPYKGENLSLVALLPDSVDGVSALEGALTSDALRSWLSLSGTEELVLHVPRFRATSGFRLEDALAALGMPSAFDLATADFSGMTGERDLCIGAVVHKAFVEVNEEGTEAVAATGVHLKSWGGVLVHENEPIDLRLDHPFLYVIRDKTTDSILFLGRVVNPIENG